MAAIASGSGRGAARAISSRTNTNLLPGRWSTRPSVSDFARPSATNHDREPWSLFSSWRVVASRRAFHLAGKSPPLQTLHFARSPFSSSPPRAQPPTLPRHTQTRRASSTSSSPSDTSPKPSAITHPIQSLKSLTPAHENIYTIPNILTFSRLAAAPLVGYFILTSQPHLTLALFAYAGITDGIDGYLARRLNQFTVVGSVIDPMADKLLMAICVLSLGYVGTFPWWLVAVVFGRDAALAVSAIWWRWISLPPPKTMARYWDFSLPSAEVHPTEISKINTLLQLLLVGNAMVLPVLPEALALGWNLWGVQKGWEALVAATTVWSGLSYIGNRDAVKIVSREEVQRVLDAREAETEGESGKEQGTK